MKESIRHIFVPLLIILFMLTGCAAPGAAHRKSAIHTGYAYAFLAQKADRLQDKNLGKARKKYSRALKHYSKAYQSGLQQLEKRHPGFKELLAEDSGAAVALTDESDTDLLYWTAAALGAAIGLSKDKPDMLIRLPQVGAMAFRVTQIEPAYGDGSAFALLMVYEASRPAMMGGSVKLAKHYYRQALEYSAGNDASLYVSYAEVICVQEQNREAFLANLNRALELKHGGMVNKIARRRAKWLLGRMDDLFL
jgi:predicted anti-sigma-YlaC factor YlaD